MTSAPELALGLRRMGIAVLLVGCAVPMPPGFACDGTPGVPVRLLIVTILILVVCLALARTDTVAGWLRSFSTDPASTSVDGSASSAATTQVPDASKMHLPSRHWFGQVFTGSEPPATDDAAWYGRPDRLATIRAHDSTFDEGAFLAAIERIFFAVLQAWTKQKPQLSQGVMGPVIWEEQKSQIQEYAREGRRNVLDPLSLSSTVIAGVRSDGPYDSIRASSSDYDIDAVTGKPIGSRTGVTDWMEDWIFQRPSTASTPEGGGTIAQPCPNCGAPVAVDVTTVYPFCNAPVISGKFVWRLTRIDRVA